MFMTYSPRFSLLQNCCIETVSCNQVLVLQLIQVKILVSVILKKMMFNSVVTSLINSTIEI